MIGALRSLVVMAASLSAAVCARANNELDLPFIRQAIQDTLSSSAVGRDSKWQNPQSGNFGAIRGGAFSKGSDGSDCRQFNWTWYYNNGLETRQGFACLDARGVWRVQQDTRVSRIDNVPTTPAAGVAAAPAPVATPRPPAPVPQPATAQVAVAKPPSPKPTPKAVQSAAIAPGKETGEVAVLPGPTLGRMPQKTLLQ